MPKCWTCGTSFQVPEDELFDHGCPNRLCRNYDLVADEIEEEDEEEL